jgi:hypothetical protein
MVLLFLQVLPLISLQLLVQAFVLLEQAFVLVLSVPLMQALVVLRAPLTVAAAGFGVGLQHAQVFVLMLHAQLA